MACQLIQGNDSLFHPPRKVEIRGLFLEGNSCYSETKTQQIYFGRLRHTSSESPYPPEPGPRLCGFRLALLTNISDNTLYIRLTSPKNADRNALFLEARSKAAPPAVAFCATAATYFCWKDWKNFGSIWQ